MRSLLLIRLALLALEEVVHRHPLIVVQLLLRGLLPPLLLLLGKVCLPFLLDSLLIRLSLVSIRHVKDPIAVVHLGRSLVHDWLSLRADGICEVLRVVMWSACRGPGDSPISIGVLLLRDPGLVQLL